MEPDSDIKPDVDLMILDYLAALAVERTLYAATNPSQQTEEEADWLIDSVRAFQTTVITGHLEKSLPWDLNIKMRVLEISNKVRRCKPALTDADIRSERPHSLSQIGVEFMDLCSAAVDKVSITRWFNTGAQFMLQAALEEHHQADTPSHTLHKLSRWTPPNSAWNPKWASIRQQYAGELPDLGDMSTVRDSLIRKFPFMGFKSSVLMFLSDLMSTLDPPLLIQLEQGQVGQLSRAATQGLKERIGIR